MTTEVTNVKPYSVKIEPDSKGFYKVTVHVYSDIPKSATMDAVALLMNTIHDLKDHGFKVLE